MPKARKANKLKNGAIRSDGAEEAFIDTIDEKFEVLDFFKHVWPKLKAAAKYGDVNAMIREYGPFSILNIVELALCGKNEKVRLAANIELMHMGEGKPIQRNWNINNNLDTINEKELDALLKSYLANMDSGDKKKLKAIAAPTKDKDE